MRCCLRNAIVLTYGIAVTGLSMRPLAAPTSRLPLTAPTSFLSQVPRSDISLGMNLGHARAQTTSLASLPKAPARAFCVQLWRHVARFAARTIVLAMLLFSVHALPALAKGGGGTGGGSGGGGGSSSSSSSYSRSYDRGRGAYGSGTTFVRTTPTVGELRMQELRDLRRRLLDLDLEKVDATVAGSTAVAVVDQKRAILQARITALQGEIVNERVIIAGGTVVVIASGAAFAGWAGRSSPSSSKKQSPSIPSRKLTADEQRRFASLQTESSNETLARRLADVGAGDMGGGDAAEASVSPSSSMNPQELPTCSLKDGSWLGTYLEDGNRGFTKYFLFFKPAGGSCFRFSGQGRDEDGEFKVEAGVYVPASGRMIWTERSLDSGLVAECTGEVKQEMNDLGTSRVVIDGEYVANSGRRGALSLSPR